MAQRITQDGAGRLTDGADVRVTEDDAGGPERLSGREPLQLVEIHQDFCSLTFGVAPCLAIAPYQPYSFDFMAGELPEGATLTRASEGSYIDEDGVLQFAVVDQERFTHAWDDAAWVLEGLLVEPARTNNAIGSEELDNASIWVPSGGTLTTMGDATSAPDGAVTADYVGRTGGGLSTNVAQGLNVPPDRYALSVHVKNHAAGTTRVALINDDPGSGPSSTFNLTWSGSEVRVISGTADDYEYEVGAASSWWHAWLIREELLGGSLVRIAIHPDRSGNVDGVYPWGVQLEEIGEAETRPSSYIRTSEAAVTREADVLVLAVPNATWDITITRADGIETIHGVVILDGNYTVPTSISPLQSVAMAPVTARSDATGTRKCYNTRATCHDPENYDPGKMTLTFARPMAALPKGLLAIPSVASIETAPTRLNIGAGSKNAGPFGSRAVATVTFRDHPSPDRLVDKYPDDRGFDPLTRGTFWTKWLARNPYYQNRRLVVRDGYVGQSLEEMVRRDYLLDRIEGPSPDGLVRVVAKDALKLAEDERAQAPRLSQGELTTAIDAAMTAFSVAPAAEQDYPESGTLRIGRELMTYAARSEADGVVTFSGVVRGGEGTAADSHDAEERAQLCLRYDAMAVQDVLHDLLVSYGNVPATFVDQVAWEQEAERWLQGFDLTALITEPTGVSSLVAEIVEQVPALIWWDERSRLIKLRADRRDETTPPVIDERDHIVAGSVSVREDPAQRISQVWVYWRQRDPTQSESSEANFSRIRILADLEAEGAGLYGESRIRKVYTRWLSTDAQATVLARRLLQRFGTNPRFLTVSLDAKDRALWTADFVQAATRLVTDDTGAEVTDLYQVVSAEETVSGHTVVYDLQRAAFASGVLAGFYMADEAPNHDAASDEQKAHGAWYAAEDGTLGDGSAGYVWQ